MATSLQVVVGRRIVEARKAAGLSQSALAREIGGATRTVQTWEAGQCHPHKDTLVRIAAVTGRPVFWFYTAADDDDAPIAA